MKKILSIGIILVLSMVTIIGCGNKEVKEAKGIFYKVEKDGKELYLAGSIHVGEKDEEYKFSEEVNSAFEDSDALAVEIDIVKVDNNEQLKYITYESGDELSNHISEDAKKCIDERLKEVGIAYDNINNYKTYYIPTLIEAFQWTVAGYDAKKGIDIKFLNEANKNKKEIVEIESLELQMNALEILGEYSDDEISDSMEKLPTLDETKIAMKNQVDSMFNGDYDEAVKGKDKMKESANDDIGKKYYKAMVTDRDQKMFDAIEKYIKEDKKYFVCVGAYHVVGEDGIVDKLEKAGYTVTRI